jgi:hypothetical protein
MCFSLAWLLGLSPPRFLTLNYRFIFDTTPLKHGQRHKLRLVAASREFHPSEDRSELPPLREEAVAGQEYHCSCRCYGETAYQ